MCKVGGEGCVEASGGDGESSSDSFTAQGHCRWSALSVEEEEE